ncbi:MAG: hypothetical protein AAGD09_22530 [Cyanobacteria bacterium P01_F01_bin.56]
MADAAKKDVVLDDQLDDVSGGVDFEQLRRENLDKDAVSDETLGDVAGGVAFDQLRRENLEKDAINLDAALRGEDFEELRRRSHDKG